ncbi:hypothetical protein ACEWPM_007685 [Roseovarius sp. S4756]|uniref:hypothetical protein n=1 Tax=Roseovarius maritimus TaxID=3342637 RepID=UPI0037271992
MFEQQMRIAQLFGAAALASNAAMFSAPKDRAGDRVSARDIAKSSTQSAKTVKRTHSFPV